MLVPFTRSPLRLDRSALGLDQIFGEFFAPTTDVARRPAVDLEQTETGLVLHAELPGVREADVDLSVHDDLLVLRAVRTSDSAPEPQVTPAAADADAHADSEPTPEPAPRRMLLEERSMAGYERRLRLPKAIDADGVRAELRHGVLRVELPYAAHATPRKIAVNAAH